MSAPRCLRCLLEGGGGSRAFSRNVGPQSLRRSRMYATESLGSQNKEDTSRSNAISKQNPAASSKRKQSQPAATSNPAPQMMAGETQNVNLEAAQPAKPIPPNVMAAYRTPVRLVAPHGIRVAQLQLRSYSVRSLEFFADFAMRVAQYLKLPASGPVPLPKKIERWTTTRSNFAHKKSQENFERITLRRLITIKDGDKRAVEAWLACLRKWQFYGVGMKANVWDWEGLDVLAKMDKDAQQVQADLDLELANFGWNSNVAESKSIEQMLLKQGIKHAGVPMTEVRDKIKDAKNVELE